MSQKGFSIIAACFQGNRGIGHENRLPWKISEDMYYFQEITRTTKNPACKNAVIMGRKTYESMGKRPLNNRVNVCVSNTLDPVSVDHFMIFRSFQEALDQLYQDPTIETIFVIGGSFLYRESIQHPDCEMIYLNEICPITKPTPQVDAFFPEIDTRLFKLIHETQINTKTANYDIIKKRFARRHVDHY
jgi:dihydrofolate reductase/thymidylate synthase